MLSIIFKLLWRLRKPTPRVAGERNKEIELDARGRDGLYHYTGLSAITAFPRTQSPNTVLQVYINQRPDLYCRCSTEQCPRFHARRGCSRELDRHPGKRLSKAPVRQSPSGPVTSSLTDADVVTLPYCAHDRGIRRQWSILMPPGRYGWVLNIVLEQCFQAKTASVTI